MLAVSSLSASGLYMQLLATERVAFNRYMSSGITGFSRLPRIATNSFSDSVFSFFRFYLNGVTTGCVNASFRRSDYLNLWRRKSQTDARRVPVAVDIDYTRSANENLFAFGQILERHLGLDLAQKESATVEFPQLAGCSLNGILDHLLQNALYFVFDG